MQKKIWRGVYRAILKVLNVAHNRIHKAHIKASQAGERLGFYQQYEKFSGAAILAVQEIVILFESPIVVHIENKDGKS